MAGLISVFGTLGTPPALAQAPPTPAGVQADSTGWTVSCASNAAGLECKAIHEIRLKTTRQLLVSAIVSIARDNKQPTLLLHLGHGMFLPAGTTLQLGKRAPQRLDIQTCDTAGCYAAIPLAKDLLSAMRTEQELTVSFQDLQKRPINVRIALNTFAAAFQKIQ